MEKEVSRTLVIVGIMETHHKAVILYVRILVLVGPVYRKIGMMMRNVLYAGISIQEQSVSIQATALRRIIRMVMILVDPEMSFTLKSASLLLV